MNAENLPKHKKLKNARSIFTHLRRYLITGIAVTSPLVITIWVLWGLFSFVDTKARSILGKTIAGIPGVGVLIFVLLILLVGIFATNLIGKRLLSLAERAVSRIPLANKIYAAVQEISTAFLGSKRSIFSTVVLVEYPRKGLYSLGFVTSEGRGEVQEKTAEHVVGVFVPTTPNPTSGLLVFVPKEELIYLNMITEDGLKLVISGGIFTPAYNSKSTESSKLLDKKD